MKRLLVLTAVIVLTAGAAFASNDSLETCKKLAGDAFESSEKTELALDACNSAEKNYPGHPELAYQQALILMHGKFKHRVFNKTIKAIELLHHASSFGYAKADYTLGMIYFSVFGGQNYKLAFKFLHKSDSKNFPAATQFLAYMYADGVGTKRDPIKAKELILRSANLNSPVSQYFVSLLYKNGSKGFGIKKNPRLSLHYENMANKQKDGEAMAAIAMWLMMGKSRQFKSSTIKKDYVSAFEWAKKSADLNNFIGQMILAFFYERDLVVPANQKLAKHWHDLALKQGGKKALDILNRLKFYERMEN